MTTHTHTHTHTHSLSPTQQVDEQNAAESGETLLKLKTLFTKFSTFLNPEARTPTRYAHATPASPPPHGTPVSTHHTFHTGPRKWSLSARQWNTQFCSLLPQRTWVWHHTHSHPASPPFGQSPPPPPPPPPRQTLPAHRGLRTPLRDPARVLHRLRGRAGQRAAPPHPRPAPPQASGNERDAEVPHGAGEDCRC